LTKTNIVNNIQLSSALDLLRDVIQPDMLKVDKLVQDLTVSKAKLIHEVGLHTIKSGGKRLRPMLTLACAKLCNYTGESHIDLAACVEFFHTATLLHDDVIDKSNLRRGNPTANNLWGNRESILVGDYLLGKAFQLIGRAKSLRVYEVLANASVVISEGEVLQLAKVQDIDNFEPYYMQIIKAKTAELFASACEVPAIISDSAESKILALREYGMNLGIAFQLVDDALDYSAKQEKLGKAVGDDFREGKLTMPVMLAYKKANSDEKNFWHKKIIENNRSDDDFKVAQKLVEKYGAIEATIKKATYYTQLAKKALDNSFPDSFVKNILTDVLGFVVAREF